MSDTKADARAMAAAIANGDGCTSFTDEQAEALREMAKAYLALCALGRMAGAARRVLGWMGWAIAGYVAAKAGALDWVRGALK